MKLSDWGIIIRHTPLSVMGPHGDAADAVALAKLVAEISDKLSLTRPLLLGHSIGCQVALNMSGCGDPRQAFSLTRPLGDQVVMNCVLQRPESYLAMALIHPVPCIDKPHRMIRPYWLVRGASLFHEVVDRTFLSPYWRVLLRQIWVLWGFTKR